MLYAIQVQPCHTTSVHAFDALLYADLQCSSPVISRDVSDVPWVHELHTWGQLSLLPVTRSFTCDPLCRWQIADFLSFHAGRALQQSMLASANVSILTVLSSAISADLTAPAHYLAHRWNCTLHICMT